MGAVYIYKRLSDLSGAELNDKFQAIRAEAEDYSGHQEGYTGNWNAIHHLSIDRTRIFQTESEAHDYVADKADRGEAMAMLVLKTPAKLTPQRTQEILTTRRTLDALVEAERRKAKDFAGLDLQRRADLAWIKAMVDKLKAGKSKTRGCAKCGSQIAVAYIKAPTMQGHCLMPFYELRETIDGALSCPVCRTPEFFVSDTDKARKATFLKAEQKAEKELEQKIKALKKKGKYPEMMIYLGGWARW